VKKEVGQYADFGNEVNVRRAERGSKEDFFLKRGNPNAGLGYMPVLPTYPIVTKRK
jgi:hypothetical protein